MERFRDTGHPVFKSISALSRRHHTTSVQVLQAQLSIYGADSNWCEQFRFDREKKEQEIPLGRKESVTKGVFIKCEFSRSETFGIFSKTCIWEQFAEKNQDFESLSEIIRFTRVCEDAIFAHRVLQLV